MTLPFVRAEIGDCRLCSLCESRSSIVFGSGNPHARLMIIGEAPMQADDQRGAPFLGDGGTALDEHLASIGLTRTDVYLTHIVKCRPLAQRLPTAQEMATCRHFLLRQIKSVDPHVILTLGRTAAWQILGVTSPLSALRGRWHDMRGLTRVVCTMTPTYVLLHPQHLSEIRKDFQLAKEAM